ncbi:basic region leucin zipper protein [Mycena pura]|uniref:Basic region leucin zipper protein n=1 Tax=Mycena pura TaxID=153505 RepID=A0AAD6UKX4_9AGAR|nr:basic region leucin zipper protein [Mycena pura]
MTRGRKKDLTIPSSRALTQQRDYRMRKAQYVADLEARCRAAEGENARLRAELKRARLGVPPPAFKLSPAAIQAAAHLRDALAAASDSLSHFMDCALPPVDGLPPVEPLAPASFSTPPLSVPSPGTDSPTPGYGRPESPCCGGFFDCDGLAGKSDEGAISMTSVSHLRSTSDADMQHN